MKLYRYMKACYHEELEGYGGENNVSVELYTYEVVKETPSGYWINNFGKRKWVSSSSKKRFAYPDKEKALENFIRRTKRSIMYNHRAIEFSELALKKAQLIKPNNHE